MGRVRRGAQEQERRSGHPLDGDRSRNRQKRQHRHPCKQDRPGEENAPQPPDRFEKVGVVR